MFWVGCFTVVAEEDRSGLQKTTAAVANWLGTVPIWSPSITITVQGILSNGLFLVITICRRARIADMWLKMASVRLVGRRC